MCNNPSILPRFAGSMRDSLHAVSLRPLSFALARATVYGPDRERHRATKTEEYASISSLSVVSLRRPTPCESAPNMPTIMIGPKSADGPAPRQVPHCPIGNSDAN